MRELADRFGTPLYVYRLDRVAAALADLRSALPAAATLYYSVKANPHPDVIAALSAAGCPLEISSDGELLAVRTAGAAPGRCLYTGPAKTEREIAAAIRSGVRLFSAESRADLGRLSRAATAVGERVRCLVRVNAPAAGATRLRMTGGASQFGADLDGLLADPPWREPVPGVEFAGAHFFAVSNTRDEQSLLATVRTAITTAALLRDRAALPLEVVDLGGGFAAPYAEPGERPRYPELRGRIEAELDEHLPGWRGGAPSVAFESGRYLVGDCGVLVCRAVEWKGSFLLLDSGINHLGGIGGLGRVLRPSATPVPAGGDRRATVVGPLCTPADVLGRDVPTGDVAPGDLVVFPNVGAYGLTASLLGFLGRPAPVEVVVRGQHVVSATQVRLVRTAPAD
jgi:diaminopimelate decarboxylase